MESLTTASLAWVNAQCAEQDTRYRSGRSYDTRYCYELWRRALEMGSDAAWSMVYERYAGLVERWIHVHPSFPASGETADFFVNIAFARFWQALSSQSFTSRFSSLEETLQYLKLSAGATVLDHLRSKQRRLLTLELDERVAATVADKKNPPVEEKIATAEGVSSLWSLATARCKNEQERVVLRQWLLYDYSARQIAEAHPDLFGNVKAVYRTKENLLKRLRRDADLRNLFAAGVEKPHQ